MNSPVTILAITTLIVGSLAWGASAVKHPQGQAECRNNADVISHMDRSRNGVSLTCDASMVDLARLWDGEGAQ